MPWTGVRLLCSYLGGLNPSQAAPPDALHLDGSCPLPPAARARDLPDPCRRRPRRNELFPPPSPVRGARERHRRRKVKGRSSTLISCQEKDGKSEI